MALADIGYPPGDPDLEPVRERVMPTWLAPRYFHEFDPAVVGRQDGVPIINGRYRRLGSRQAANWPPSSGSGSSTTAAALAVARRRLELPPQAGRLDVVGVRDAAADARSERLCRAER